jgi:hypothetical protein
MNEERSQERARPVRQKPPTPGVFGLLIVLVVVGAAAALWFATRDQTPVQAQQPAADSADPFADLPPEAPPEKQATTKGEAAREE